MPRPRLLIVAPSAELYGSDRSLLQLLPLLSEEFDVVVAAPMDGALVDHCQDRALPVEVLPDYAIRQRHLRPAALIPWLFRAVRAMHSLHRLHRRQAFDLVYSATLASGIGSVLKRLWGVPHVQHIREYPYHGTIRRRLLLSWVSSTSDRVICNSGYVRDACVREVPGLAARSTVVHNGVDPPSPLPDPNPTDGPLRVACVGRLGSWKGQSVLVEAAERAIREGASWKLHFFGDSLPEHEERAQGLHDQVVESGLGAHTTFHGFVSDQDEIYRDVDVVVVPSEIPEPFGRTVIEAQVRAIPVVASAPGGPAEVIIDHETGFLVPIGNAAALATAIRRLEDPELRREMGLAGQARTVAESSTATYVNRVGAVLADAARSAGETPRPSCGSQPMA